LDGPIGLASHYSLLCPASNSARAYKACLLYKKRVPYRLYKYSLPYCIFHNPVYYTHT
jgi:hypothetical protein